MFDLSGRNPIVTPTYYPCPKQNNVLHQTTTMFIIPFIQEQTNASVPSHLRRAPHTGHTTPTSTQLDQWLAAHLSRLHIECTLLDQSVAECHINDQFTSYRVIPLLEDLITNILISRRCKKIQITLFTSDLYKMPMNCSPRGPLTLVCIWSAIGSSMMAHIGINYYSVVLCSHQSQLGPFMQSFRRSFTSSHPHATGSLDDWQTYLHS